LDDLGEIEEDVVRDAMDGVVGHGAGGYLPREEQHALLSLTIFLKNLIRPIG